MITYEGPKNPAGDPKIINYMRTEFFPKVTSGFERGGLDAYYYGNFNRDHTKWTSFPAEGRYGTTYFGLRNRLSAIRTSRAGTGKGKARIAVIRCRLPNRTLDDVSDPVSATPSQPSIVPKNGYSTPVPAKARPSVASSPE